MSFSFRKITFLNRIQDMPRLVFAHMTCSCTLDLTDPGYVGPQGSLWALFTISVYQTPVFWAQNCTEHRPSSLHVYFEALVIRHEVKVTMLTCCHKRGVTPSVPRQRFLFLISCCFLKLSDHLQSRSDGSSKCHRTFFFLQLLCKSSIDGLATQM